MTDIDWSKAPAHATHWSHGNARIEGGWIHQSGGEFYSCYNLGGLEHIPDFPSWRESRLVPRPTTWNGEGLPPVGTICECQDEAFQWHSGTIVHVGQGDGAMVAVIQTESGILIGESGEFRPIRTHEQIAAEEREKAIEEMWKVYWQPDAPTAKQALGLLYDAGYRKVEGGAP